MDPFPCDCWYFVHMQIYGIHFLSWTINSRPFIFLSGDAYWQWHFSFFFNILLFSFFKVQRLRVHNTRIRMHTTNGLWDRYWVHHNCDDNWNKFWPPWINQHLCNTLINCTHTSVPRFTLQRYRFTSRHLGALFICNYVIVCACRLSFTNKLAICFDSFSPFICINDYIITISFY